METPKLASPAERDQATARLAQAFAQDVLSVEEYERRLTQLYEAKTSAEILALTRDLPGAVATAAKPAPTPAPARAMTPAERIESGPVLQAVFSNLTRKSAALRRHQVVQAIFGSAELDYSEALLPDVETEIEIVAALGSVEITLPWNVEIVNDGSPILGSFEVHERTKHSVYAQEARPRVRISGFAVLGSVEIRTAPRPTE